jgi:hypothetical protein
MVATTYGISVDRARAEDRQQKHPEHDRAIEAAPVRRDLVEQRLRGLRVVRNVLDGEIVGEKRVDDDSRSHGHQRADEVEGANPAFDQPARLPTRTDDRDDCRIAADDEGSEKEKRS